MHIVTNQVAILKKTIANLITQLSQLISAPHLCTNIDFLSPHNLDIIKLMF